MSIKNIWSLTVDEALVADKLKQEFSKKEYEVFLPVNLQLKDIDLILFDLKKCKSLTIQVKGSRTYDPNKSETERFGEGSAAWITVPKQSIFKSSNKIDFFIFVLHSFVDGAFKKEIKISFLVLPCAEFKKLVLKKLIRKNNKYHFFIWVDVKKKRAFDFNDRKHIINLSKYFNNWKILGK